MLAIWTKEDDEAGRTKPSLDTSSVAGVAGSNKRSTGDLTAEDVPSINRSVTDLSLEEIGVQTDRSTATVSAPMGVLNYPHPMTRHRYMGICPPVAVP